MSNSSGFQRSPLGAVLLLLLAAAPIAAQTPDPAQADALRYQAEALYNSLPRLREAAELHMLAASLRPEADPERVRDLDVAGKLYVYAGDPITGQKVTEEAARAAIAAGDLNAAGHLWLDAAFVAFLRGAKADVRSLVERGRWIAAAPDLDDQQQKRLQARLTE